MELFVPGRICLFGEHSDWAGGYRRVNSALEKGYTVLTGTNQGIHARIEPHPGRLIVRAALSDGRRIGPFEVDMDPRALLEEAEKGGFFSYIAGVAYQIATHYRVRGLAIDNYRTDLPVKKGLSSSAAICVLTARAFNKIYDLKMTVRGEMEVAYLGEIVTPSRCGRMDQGCAFGNRPILMIHDRDLLAIRELRVGADLYIIIVDLRASKDTKKILADLNKCYPFAQDEKEERVQHYLGPLNREIVAEAVRLLEAGDAEALGRLMTRAQARFDEALAPACPEELTAPVLHEVLSYRAIQPYIWGGKGVGSQGDGCAQLVARGPDAREKAIEILEGELGLECLRLDIQAGRSIRKALIPAAGYETLLLPATKAVKKELFPIVGPDGIARPVILWIVEEVLSAGIEEIAIVVAPEDVDLFESFFNRPIPLEALHRMPQGLRAYCERLADVGQRITILSQESPEGLGQAVFVARDWVGDEPFLLLLGDHLYASEIDVPCAQQLLDVFATEQASVVSLQRTPAARIASFGVVGGMWRKEGELLEVMEFVEKPTIDYAREHLRVDGLPEDEYLTLFGQYALEPDIFAYLEDEIRRNARERGIFTLTGSLERLREERQLLGYVAKGRRYDTGDPASYLEAVGVFGGLRRPRAARRRKATHGE